MKNKSFYLLPALLLGIVISSPVLAKETISVCPALKDLTFNLRDPMAGQRAACEGLPFKLQACYSTMDMDAKYKDERWFIGSATYAASEQEAKAAISTVINASKSLTPTPHEDMCTFIIDKVKVTYFEMPKP